MPPLNRHLAGDLVSRTRVARLLAGYRDHPPCDLAALESALVDISQLVADLPEVVELDVNPLLVSPEGVLAVDARVRVEATDVEGSDHLVIRPYPRDLEETVSLSSGESVLVRPVKPEDEPGHRRLFEALTDDSVYFRFFSRVRFMPHERLSRYTQIDYDREMAFIAVRGSGSLEETLGVVRLIFGSRPEDAEFAIVVRDDVQGEGLGRALMDKAIRYCRQRGTSRVTGQILWENHRMRALARELGFVSKRIGTVVEVTLSL